MEIRWQDGRNALQVRHGNRVAAAAASGIPEQCTGVGPGIIQDEFALARGTADARGRRCRYDRRSCAGDQAAAKRRT